MLTSIESNDRFTLKQRLHFHIDRLQFLFDCCTVWFLLSFMSRNIELLLNLVYHLLLVRSESQQPDKLDGVLSVIVEVLILSCHHERKTLMCALQTHSEIKERDVQTHKSLQCIV